MQLRPEAQPVQYWTSFSPEHRLAFRRLVEMLCEAVQRVRQKAPRVHPQIPWLFMETRSQLAFLDGMRGSGKTTLMSTLVAAIYDDKAINYSDSETAADPEDLAVFKNVCKRIEQELRGNVVCVQPLDMEPLPSGTSLMSAILTRILRALQPSGAKRPHRLLDEPPHESRELIRLRQFIYRAAQALNSNLHDRRGHLDPEQYGTEVLKQEDRRLELPSDLDRVLSHQHHADEAHPTDAGDPSARRLFLVPIDDVDLNPRHCLDLLQLLRSFSPPAELFFLLMGQFELVERCVELQIAGQFAKLYREAKDLSGLQRDQFQQEIRRIALLNVRKMIPPHTLCTLPHRLELTDILSFRPLGHSASNSTYTLQQLLESIPLYTLSGEPARVASLFELFFGAKKLTPDQLSTIRSNDWTVYCGNGVLRASFRRLADFWMDLRRLRQETPTNPANQIACAQYATKVQAVLESFLHRTFDLDAELTASDRQRLIRRRQHHCKESLVEAPSYQIDLEVLNAQIDCEPEQGNRTAAGPRNTYRPQLRFTSLTQGSGIPFFAIADDNPPQRTPGSPHSVDAEKVSAQKNACDEQTRCALTVLHDLHEFLRPDSATLSGFPDLTSERPVHLAWVGNEGEVASFEWPIPPLPTYHETTRFLKSWHECSQLYLRLVFTGTSDGVPRQENRLDLNPETLPTQLSEAIAVHRRIKHNHNYGETFDCLESRELTHVKNLVGIWILLGCFATIRSQPKSRALDKLVQKLARVDVSDANCLQKILRTAISCTMWQRQLNKRNNLLREWVQLDKWLRRIGRLVQPEFLTVIGARSLMNMVDTRSLSSTPLLHSHELVVGILRQQRQQRLQALWKSDKRQLWRKLNRPEEINSPLLIVLPEPEMDTQDDIRVQMRRLEGLVERAQTDFKTSTEEIQSQLLIEAKRQELRTLMQLVEVQAKSRPADALEQMQRSTTLFDELRTLRPADMGLVNEYLNQCYRVSEAFQQQNELPFVKMVSQRVVDLLRSVVIQQPDNTAVKRQFSVAMYTAGSVCESMENWWDAEDLFRESLQIDRELLAKLPGNAQAARDVSISLIKCGNVCVQSERWEEAETLFRESLQITRDLLAESPTNAQAARNVSVSLIKCGNVCVHSERWDEAETLFRESLQITRKLLAESPSNAQAARDVGVALEGLGIIAARSDEPLDAIPYIEEAEAAYNAVLAAAPAGNIEPRADLIDLRLQYLSLLLRLRRVASARVLMQEETIRQCIDILRQQGSSTRHRVLVALWDFFEARLTTNVKKRRELMARAADVLDSPKASRLLRVTTGFYLINRDYLEYKKILSQSPTTQRKRKK